MTLFVTYHNPGTGGFQSTGQTASVRLSEGQPTPAAGDQTVYAFQIDVVTGVPATANTIRIESQSSNEKSDSFGPCGSTDDTVNDGSDDGSSDDGTSDDGSDEVGGNDNSAEGGTTQPALATRQGSSGGTVTRLPEAGHGSTIATTDNTAIFLLFGALSLATMAAGITFRQRRME